MERVVLPVESWTWRIFPEKSSLAPGARRVSRLEEEEVADMVKELSWSPGEVDVPTNISFTEERKSWEPLRVVDCPAMPRFKEEVPYTEEVSILVTAIPPERVEVELSVWEKVPPIRVVKVPAAAVVPPMTELSIVPPSMVRASTISASWMELAGTMIFPDTSNPVVLILVERRAGMEEVPDEETVKSPSTVNPVVSILVASIFPEKVEVPAPTVIFWSKMASPVET